MSVFFWKKRQLFKKSKVRLLCYVAIPILVFVFFHLRNIEKITIGFSYILVTSSLLNMVVFEVEDLAFSEAILCTPKTLKQVWLSNFFVNIVHTVFVSLVYFIAYILIFDREQLLNHLSYAAIAALLSSSLQLLSLVHLSDYSKLKQWLASFAAIIFIFYPAYIVYTNKIFVEVISFDSLSIGITLSSAVIVGVSFVFLEKAIPKP